MQLDYMYLPVIRLNKALATMLNSDMNFPTLATISKCRNISYANNDSFVFLSLFYFQ